MNAFPAKNGEELDKSIHKPEGAEIAENYLSQIQPKIVIIHHRDALAAIQKFVFFILGEKFHELDEFATHHVDAHWNGNPTSTFSIPALTAREKGWSDVAIREIAGKIKVAAIE